MCRVIRPTLRAYFMWRYSTWCIALVFVLAMLSICRFFLTASVLWGSHHCSCCLFSPNLTVILCLILFVKTLDMLESCWSSFLSSPFFALHTTSTHDIYLFSSSNMMIFWPAVRLGKKGINWDIFLSKFFWIQRGSVIISNRCKLDKIQIDKDTKK